MSERRLALLTLIILGGLIAASVGAWAQRILGGG